MSPWWLRGIVLLLLIAAAALPLRLHRADAKAQPEQTTAGHRLAAAWCKECHAIEAGEASDGKGPAFARIAQMPSTTALSLNVFLRSNHTNMPNLIIAPGDASEIVQYILSLKRN